MHSIDWEGLRDGSVGLLELMGLLSAFLPDHNIVGSDFLLVLFRRILEIKANSGGVSKAGQKR